METQKKNVHLRKRKSLRRIDLGIIETDSPACKSQNYDCIDDEWYQEYILEDGQVKLDAVEGLEFDLTK